MWRRTTRSLQDYVSSWFYTHGLFCASHPVAIISLVITVALIICYPLFNIPLPGNTPIRFVTPEENYKLPPTLSPTDTESQNVADDDIKGPRWYVGTPVAYVQQVVVRAVVSPWLPHKLIQTDAFRAPLAKAFDVLEQVNQFHYKDGLESMSFSDVCLHVSETQRHKKVKGLVPEYGCLIVSPANFWGRDKSRFSSDSELVRTIYKKYGPTVEPPPSIQDILFGIPLRDIGVKRYFLRNRQRVISFAVTMVLSKYDRQFLSALEGKLHEVFPDGVSLNQSSTSHLVHVHYKDMDYFVEYTPLLVTYIVLFLYIYFSVSKFEMVKSKWGLALSAVATVVASLLISVSICTVFGFTPSLYGSEIFPYLVVIIGLENVLVVTKSVVSTPVHLDVKLRVAQGLRKEGWYIFKNLMLEMLILAVGFFTFVPAIQEFCLFAVVGLLSDFFLQMFFFVTVLSVDIRRMELSDLHRQSVQRTLQNSAAQGPLYKSNGNPHITVNGPPATQHPQRSFHTRSKSVPGIVMPPDSPAYELGSFPTPPPSPTSASSQQDDAFFPEKIWRTPRRVRFMNIWARTRVVQRGIMMCVVIWISLIVYKTGLVEFLVHTTLASVTSGLGLATKSDPVHPSSEPLHPPPEPTTPLPSSHKSESHSTMLEHGLEKTSQLFNSYIKGIHGEPFFNNEKTELLFAPSPVEPWEGLRHMHWPTLFGYYNISLYGRYITILPSVNLNLVVDPEDAIAMRHPGEHEAISHLDNIVAEHPEADHRDNEVSLEEPPEETTEESSFWGSAAWRKGELPQLDLNIALYKIIRVPRTKRELVATLLLIVASVILVAYFLTVLYRCMCSRNYAKWRTSLSKRRRNRLKQSPYFKQIRESVPLLLHGHEQEVECVVTDGTFVVTSCLGGQLRLWDSISGECVTTIKRGSSSQPGGDARSRHNGVSDEDLLSSYYKVPVVHDEGDTASPEGPPIGRRRNHSRGHSRHRSVDFGDLLPDLSTTIDTEFSHIPSVVPPTPVPAQAPAPAPAPTPAPAPAPAPAPPQRPRIHQHRRNLSADYNIIRNLAASPASPATHTLSSSYSVGDSLANMNMNHSNSSSRESLGLDISDGDPTQINQSWNSHRTSWNGGVNIPECSQRKETSPGYPGSNGIHKGFDFSKFAPLYEEHKQAMAEKEEYLRQRRRRSQMSDKRLSESPNGHAIFDLDSRTSFSSQMSGDGPEVLATSDLPTEDTASPVWSLACQDNLIVAGCADGRIELWDGMNGQLKFVYHESEVGVTAICFTEYTMIAARLNGMVDFLQVKPHLDITGVSPMGNSHYSRSFPQRSQSLALVNGEMKFWDCLQVSLVATKRAHQQPINILQAEARRAVTGSQDHTLKVFRLEDSACLYTLHGHKGAITAVYLDKLAPLAAASGSEDGTVRLWDLISGACVHKLEGHDATVVSLTCTAMYVVSTGMDDRLCIWERCKGHLLHWIQMEPGYCNSVAMLTSNLMVTGGQGCIYLWDVSKGHALRAVQLGDEDHSIFVRQLRVIKNATVVCDYGNQLRVIHFPAVLEKAD